MSDGTIARHAVTATVVIPTRNRKDHLRRSLQSAVGQDIDCEILVLDDMSVDGTPDMVREEFPSVRLIVAQRPFGGAPAIRNCAAQLANGEFIVSIDDDAEFSTPTIVRQAIAAFSHPRIGAISLPHKDILISPDLKTPAAPRGGVWVVPSYVGTAYALRREVFLQLGGFRGTLLHQTEERDFCTRMLNFGYVTALADADPVLHYASPVRELWRNQILERRNDICHAVWNVPFPDLIYHLPGTVISGLRFGISRGTLRQTVTGYANSVRVVGRTLGLRDPIETRIYRLMLRLNRRRVMPLDEVLPSLGPIGVWPGRGPGRTPDWSTFETVELHA